VNCIGFDRFDEVEAITDNFTFEVEDELLVPVIQFCIDNLGVPYSLKEVVGIAYVLIKRSHGQYVDNPFDSGNAQYFCSQFVDVLLENFVGVKSSNPPSCTTPLDLYQTLVSLGVPHLQNVNCKIY
jgi:hypothetical protein